MATVSVTLEDGVTLLRVDGSLTHEGVVPVVPVFEEATRHVSNRVVVDLSNVPVLTTPGLSMLLATARRLDQGGGRLVVTGAQGPVDDLLRRCRLDAILNLVSDPEVARQRAKE